MNQVLQEEIVSLTILNHAPKLHPLTSPSSLIGSWTTENRGLVRFSQKWLLLLRAISAASCLPCQSPRRRDMAACKRESGGVCPCLLGFIMSRMVCRQLSDSSTYADCMYTCTRTTHMCIPVIQGSYCLWYWKGSELKTLQWLHMYAPPQTTPTHLVRGGSFLSLCSHTEKQLHHPRLRVHRRSDQIQYGHFQLCILQHTYCGMYHSHVMHHVT